MSDHARTYSAEVISNIGDGGEKGLAHSAVRHSPDFLLGPFGLKMALVWPKLPPSCNLIAISMHLLGHVAAKLLEDASMMASSRLRCRLGAVLGTSGGPKTYVFLRLL